jgi:hypothetical protein
MGEGSKTYSMENIQQQRMAILRVRKLFVLKFFPCPTKFPIYFPGQNEHAWDFFHVLKQK